MRYDSTVEVEKDPKGEWVTFENFWFGKENGTRNTGSDVLVLRSFGLQLGLS